ncbi:MAG: hypothetical protein ABSA85_16655 [Terracidiphilus sp.]
MPTRARTDAFAKTQTHSDSFRLEGRIVLVTGSLLTIDGGWTAA